MIKQLNIFSVASYVVAQDWNANFSALNQSNNDCSTAITDAENQLAFVGEDLTPLFNAVDRYQNSEDRTGNTDPIVPNPEHEYFSSLANGQDLFVEIPAGFTGEFRIWIKHSDKRQPTPINFTFDGGGTVSWENGFSNWYTEGTKIVFVYVVNNVAYVKMIKTTGA